MQTNQVSAKMLGALALRPYCPRCSWIYLHCQLPYQRFPGIFSTIDSYTKKVVHGYFDLFEKSPPWLAEIGNIVGYIDPPHHSKFRMSFEDYGILMTGVADTILKLDDGSLCIADYKTTRFSKAQSALMPQHLVQLNGYAKIAETIGLGKVSKIALIFMEPQSSQESASNESNRTDVGFKMPFAAKVLEIDLNPPKYLAPVLKKARRLLDLKSPPQSTANCKECNLLMQLYCSCHFSTCDH